MDKIRKIKKVLISQTTLGGAGVHLPRGCAFREAPMFDPFLMFDDFRQDDPDKYLPRFPWPPHRGIETITYMLRGTAEHGDSMGNSGVIGPGEVQWMTAGSGIVHQEMPKGGADGRMGGFQLWANLPASQKMMDPRDPPLAYVFEGQGCFSGDARPDSYEVEPASYFDLERRPLLGDHSVILFGDGGRIKVTTADFRLRFLLISGRPLGEPVAWQGPLVINTQEELRTAFREYRAGTFIKQPKPV